MPKTFVSFEGGKYSIVHDKGLDLHILRYGEPWVEAPRVSCPKMMVGIVAEIQELRAIKVEHDKALATSIAAGFVGCTPAQVIEMQDFNITALEKTAKQREGEHQRLRTENLRLSLRLRNHQI